MKRHSSHKIKKLVHTRVTRTKTKIFSLGFDDWFGFASLSWLVLSVVYWAYLSASLHQNNADQLVNPYLFESFDTFRSASLPAAHTFLLKWPLFLIIKFFNFSDGAFVAVTVGTVLATILGFVYLLYRIDRRPFVWGSICLTLASMLLFVPIEPYPGAVLPANLGMLTTRNIEYLIFIIAALALITARSVRTKYYWIGTLGLALLIASDKLFFALSIGAGMMLLVGSLLSRNKTRVRDAGRSALAAVIGYVVSTGILVLAAGIGLTQISSPGSSNPYGFVTSIHELLTGLFFAVFGALTNVGANPLFDIATRETAQAVFWQRITNPSIGGFVINLVLTLLGVLLSVRLIIEWLLSRKTRPSTTGSLAVYLLAACIVSFIIFSGTKHYFPVDARYLALLPFTIILVFVTYVRKVMLHRSSVVLFAGIMFMCSILGGLAFKTNYRQSLAAHEPTNKRNRLVSQVVKSHKVDTLLGDYWRVLPIKHLSEKSARVTPLANCTEPRQALSSKEWQPDLNNSSFAYLLSFDKSLTDFPSCNLEQVTKSYGRPNASVLVAGEPEKPKEMVLFYDKGANKSAPVSLGNVDESSLSTIIPTLARDLRRTTCSANRKTIMNVVAHQDDDILFQNPDLQHDINDLNCIRTVYVTAGDAGGDPQYWLSREKGAQAAYNHMLKQNAIWEERSIKLETGQYITVTNPQGNRSISLIFLRLPDGNIHGTGFAARNYESLERLVGGYTTEIHSVDGQSTYDKSSLAKTITAVMEIYLPDEVRTQAQHYSGASFPDHSDHSIVGELTSEAHRELKNASQVPLKYYDGYPGREQPENVFNQDQTEKFMTFLEYAKHDGGVCNTMDTCLGSPTYGSYLRRQYRR